MGVVRFGIHGCLNFCGHMTAFALLFANSIRHDDALLVFVTVLVPFLHTGRMATLQQRVSPSLVLMRSVAAVQQGGGYDAEDDLQDRGGKPDAVDLKQAAHDKYDDAHDDGLGHHQGV